MKKLCAGLALTLVFAGCALNPTVQYPHQAEREAEYYEAQAAALEKQVERQNHVIDRLKERIEDAKNSGRHYDKRVESTEERLKELKEKSPDSEAERKAISQLIRDWRAQKKHLQTGGQDQQSVVNFLQEQLRMQRGFRDDIEKRIRNLRKKAHKMRELASKMKAKEQDKQSVEAR